MRQISVGVFTGSTWVHILYYAGMILCGVAFTTLRLRALFLR
jgi:lipooligosaccharide transport system permease protein